MSALSDLSDLSEKEHPRRYSGNPLADLTAIAFVAFTFLILGRALLLAPRDPNRLCVDKQHQVWTAAMEYTQDWDGRLPAMQTPAVFARLMADYLTDQQTPTTCPATGKLYKPNASLSSLLLVSIGGSKDTTELLRDAVAHSDRQFTVVFLDGHVEHGGRPTVDPTAGCISNTRELVRTVTMYAQDYDEVLPPINSRDQVHDLLYPYAQTERIFTCPATHLSYAYNNAISYQTLASFPSLATVEFVRDSQAHSDGKVTVGFLDEHVERGGKTVDPSNTDLYCASRMKQLGLGMAMYIQDYDEVIPGGSVPWAQQLGPYVRDNSAFVCPARLQNYAFDNSLRNTPLAAHDAVKTAFAGDSVAHENGTRTAAFLDGHVEQNGHVVDTNNPAQPDADALSRAKQVGLALLMYAQDYDEKFPPMDDYSRFRNILLPYAKNPVLFMVPPTNEHWVLNQSLGYKSFADIAEPAKTETFRAPRPGRGRLIIKAYADGHVRRTIP